MSFEKATREKFRFPSAVGLLTIEDLWDLPLQTSRSGKADLDSTAKAISRSLKAQEEESFVVTSTNKIKAELAEMLEIVVHIIGVKQAENAAALSAAERKAQKLRLTEILHLRTQQDLMTKSPAEIEAMIAALDSVSA